jgi:uncharacterized membrane-anchored protein YitT (DUF2179 family)
MTLNTKVIQKYLFLIIGAIIVAIALELFLVPNGMVDGGVVGISIMLSHLTGLSLGIFLIVLNIPFFFLGYKQIGLTFCISTIVSIVLMSIGTTVLHDVKPFTTEPLLAVVFGGVLMGIGVGIIMKAGGCTDGIEVSSILVAKKTPLTVGQAIMFFNLFILLGSGFVFGWDNALYSLVAYFIAFKTIDIVVEGLDESRSAWIMSEQHKEIGEAIQARLGRSVTYMDVEGGYTGECKRMIFVVITRLEEAKLKQIVEEKDENAFLAIGHVHEVKGGNFKKKDIH